MCQSNHSSAITISFIMVLIMLSKWSWTNDANVPNSQINFWKMKPKLLVVDKLQVNRRKIVQRIRLNRVTFPTNEALTTIIAARKKNRFYCTHTHTSPKRKCKSKYSTLVTKAKFSNNTYCVCVCRSLNDDLCHISSSFQHDGR